MGQTQLHEGTRHHIEMEAEGAQELWRQRKIRSNPKHRYTWSGVGTTNGLLSLSFARTLTYRQHTMSALRPRAHEHQPGDCNFARHLEGRQTQTRRNVLLEALLQLPVTDSSMSLTPSEFGATHILYLTCPEDIFLLHLIFPMQFVARTL